MSDCPFDDGWPSERHLHGGPVGLVAVPDERPVARMIDGEPGLLPEPSVAWRTVEACQQCARRLTGSAS